MCHVVLLLTEELLIAKIENVLKFKIQDVLKFKIQNVLKFKRKFRRQRVNNMGTTTTTER